MKGYNPMMKLRVGDRLVIEGTSYEIVERHSNDEFKVRNRTDGTSHVKHIDWFSEECSHSEELMVVR